MRRVEWHVTEERAALVLLDKPQRVVGEVINDEPFALDELPVVLQRRVEVTPPVAGAKAVVFVEPAGVGVIRVLGAVMPFAEGARGVAGRFERVANGLLVQVESLAAGGDAVDAAARVGEQTGQT